jgi:methenyltetrahydrofolate cyclohydrolase
MTIADDVLDLSVRALLDEVAARTSSPAAGSVAAVVLGLAAGLTSMAARFSIEHWDGAAGAARLAEDLRLRAAPLAQADAESYARVLEALRMAKESDPEVRSAEIARALGEAADIPFEIARIGAEVAELAADVANHGNPNLRGDAATGAVLAESSARAAAALVAINLASHPGDGRIEGSSGLVSIAAAAAARALSSAASPSR